MCAFTQGEREVRIRAAAEHNCRIVVSYSLQPSLYLCPAESAAMH
jgi:hypothetical protein